MSQAGQGVLSAGAGSAGHADAVTAAELACDQALSALGEGADPDFVLAFASSQHAELMGAIGDVIHRRLSPGAFVACSGEAVLGGQREYEGLPAVSLLAFRAPGVAVHPFTSEDLPVIDEEDGGLGEKIAGAIGADRDTRAVLFFADPFSVPTGKLLPALSRTLRETLGVKGAPIIGGMASAGPKPGANGLVLNKRLSRTGAVGVTLRGRLSVETVVSQGCKPVGQNLVVTGARNNILLTLSGKPALEALHEMVESLPASDRGLLDKGVMLGRVINEYKERFGRGDFLIRNVLGVEQSRGALAVADLLRVGQTVRFHLRDAVTADEDLRLLLEGQRLREPPAGVLLVTCNSRGTRLFDKPNHDAATVSEALTPEGGAPPPLAGFFAAGEIGPIGGEAFVHGHTACVACFRRPGGGLLDD